MDDELTRLSFRARGGDRAAASALLVHAAERQHSATFERAARALGAGPAVLSILEGATSSDERAAVRALLPSPLEAATALRPPRVDLEAVTRIGPAALVATARWAIEGLRAVPKLGGGSPYVGAAVAEPWRHIAAAFAARVEAPWLAIRVVAEVDPAKRALSDAVVGAYFGTYGDRGALAAEALLGEESPAARRLLWTRLLTDHPGRIDDAAVAGLLDDAATRELASDVLTRRGPGAARHSLPYLHAASPGTRRAVAALLAAVGDDGAVPFLRQAIARERDARARVTMSVALERISGAEPLVPKHHEGVVGPERVRAALSAPRQPRAPGWLSAAETPDLVFRDGVRISRPQIDAIAGRLALLRADHDDALVLDLRAAVEPASLVSLVDALRRAYAASGERRLSPEWLVRAAALLLPEAAFDLTCEAMDVALRAPAIDRWRRGSLEAGVAWDPEAVASSPCRVAFAWLVHWSESAPKRRDRDRAQRALARATNLVPESERPFAHLRRYGLDDDGARRFTVDAETLVVRVPAGGAGAIVVEDERGEQVRRLAPSALGGRVKDHVASLEGALLDARRSLAEAYADRLVVDARFVRAFLLTHPLWRPVVLGCVVRRERAPETLRLGEDALAAVPEDDRLRFVLSQVEG